MNKAQKTAPMAHKTSGGFSSMSLLRGVPASRLRRMEQKSEVREVPVGHIFFELGGAGQELFLLEKGRVQTFRNLGERRLIISELAAPEIFGEMGCIGQGIYHCSAQAAAPSRVRIVPRKALDDLLKDFPQVTRRLLDLVSRRFVHVLLDLEGMSFRPLLPRLAALLLERAEGDAVRNLTHKELAEHLRVYRESATTVLGELRKAGIIAIERKQIRILDRTRLERASRE
jgi:CRP/FNR family cyclic AMP-dependent transcriptional regulator